MATQLEKIKQQVAEKHKKKDWDEVLECSYPYINILENEVTQLYCAKIHSLLSRCEEVIQMEVDANDMEPVDFSKKYPLDKQVKWGENYKQLLQEIKEQLNKQ